MKRYTSLNSYFKLTFGNRIHKIIIDTGLSCPNRNGVLNSSGCIYCNYKGSGNNLSKQNTSILSQININKKIKKKFLRTKNIIVYFQSFSNTYTTAYILEQFCFEAISLKNIIGVSIATRPDCINKTKLDILEYYSKKCLIWIEYGLQSSHDKTLYLINRGSNTYSFIKAIGLTKKRKIKTCSHIILGIPTENRKQMLKTADFISTVKTDSVKMHMMYIIKNTIISLLYKKKGSNFLTKTEYVSILCNFIERLKNKTIIQRLNSDPNYEELILPLWTINKKSTLLLFSKILKLRDTCQKNKIKKKLL